MTRYESAKELYSKFGINTDEALEKLSNITVSVHCWQGDDVGGFDGQTWKVETAYSPDIAQERYNSLKSNRGPQLKIGKDIALANYIEQKIAHDHYSPAAALADIKRNGLKFSTTICKATVYSYIRKGVFLNLSYSDLPCKGIASAEVMGRPCQRISA